MNGAYWFIGASGTGKTTLARAVCNELGDMDRFYIGGADCDVDFVRSLQSTFGLSTWGESGYKACIVDEAQAITPRAVQAWLPFLEALPAKRLVIFTSNICRDDLFGDFRGPLFSRCKVCTLDLDWEAAAAHVARIASAENLNGQPIEAYRRLLAECDGNIRAALQRVEKGEMLKCVTNIDTVDRRDLTPIAKLQPNSIPCLPIAAIVTAGQDTQSKPPIRSPMKMQKPIGTKAPICTAAVTSAINDLPARLQAEIAYGARFRPGTKNPRYFEHVARLQALEREGVK